MDYVLYALSTYQISFVALPKVELDTLSSQECRRPYFVRTADSYNVTHTYLNWLNAILQLASVSLAALVFRDFYNAHRPIPSIIEQWMKCQRRFCTHSSMRVQRFLDFSTKCDINVRQSPIPSYFFPKCHADSATVLFNFCRVWDTLDGCKANKLAPQYNNSILALGCDLWWDSLYKINSDMS